MFFLNVPQLATSRFQAPYNCEGIPVLFRRVFFRAGRLTTPLRTSNTGGDIFHPPGIAQGTRRPRPSYLAGTYSKSILISTSGESRGQSVCLLPPHLGRPPWPPLPHPHSHTRKPQRDTNLSLEALPSFRVKQHLALVHRLRKPVP